MPTFSWIRRYSCPISRLSSWIDRPLLIIKGATITIPWKREESNNFLLFVQNKNKKSQGWGGNSLLSHFLSLLFLFLAFYIQEIYYTSNYYTKYITIQEIANRPWDELQPGLALMAKFSPTRERNLALPAKNHPISLVLPAKKGVKSLALPAKIFSPTRENGFREGICL